MDFLWVKWERNRGNEERGQREAANEQKAIAWSYIQWLNIFFCSKKRGAFAVGGPRWGRANLHCLNSAAIYYSSKSSDAGRRSPLLVCVTLWVRASVKFCVFALSVQTIQLSLWLSHRQNQPPSLTRDPRLQETTLGPDMNYRTEGNLNKMNSWITNISCLFFSFLLLFCFPWCSKHQRWGGWASL